MDAMKKTITKYYTKLKREFSQCTVRIGCVTIEDIINDTVIAILNDDSFEGDEDECLEYIRIQVKKKIVSARYAQQRRINVSLRLISS